MKGGMWSLRHLGALVVPLVFAQAGPAPHVAPRVFSAAADFSPTNNPNGAWSYGWSQTLGSSFNAFPFKEVEDQLDFWRPGSRTEPSIRHNGTAQPVVAFGTARFEPGEQGLHPGPAGQYALVRWTAPFDGSFSIAASFFGESLTVPTTTDVHILWNGSAVFDALVNGFGSGSARSYRGTLSLRKGDRIDFAVGCGQNRTYTYDSTGLSALVTAVP